MPTEVEDFRPGEPEPDLDLARRAALVAHSVVIKLQEMGLPQELNDDLASLSTDLGDLWGAHATLSANLEGLSRSPHEWDAVGDYMVDIRACIDHIAWHLKSVRGPLGRIGRYAYRQAAGAEGGP